MVMCRITVALDAAFTRIKNLQTENTKHKTKKRKHDKYMSGQAPACIELAFLHPTASECSELASAGGLLSVTDRLVLHAGVRETINFPIYASTQTKHFLRPGTLSKHAKYKLPDIIRPREECFANTGVGHLQWIPNS